MFDRNICRQIVATALCSFDYFIHGVGVHHLE
jgi:hypothetical protein